MHMSDGARLDAAASDAYADAGSAADLAQYDGNMLEFDDGAHRLCTHRPVFDEPIDAVSFRVRDRAGECIRKCAHFVVFEQRQVESQARVAPARKLHT